MKKVITLVSLILFTSSSWVIAQSQSAEELARAFNSARNAFDYDQQRSLLTEDAQIIDFVGEVSVDDFLSLQKHGEAQAFSWNISSCEAIDAVEGEVTCSYTVENGISRALGLDPIAGGVSNFVIDDGKISMVKYEFPFDFWEPNVWRPMIAFIRSNHEEDFPKMFRDNGSLIGVSDEGLALWKSHTEEFAEVMAAAMANENTTASEQLGLDFLGARTGGTAEEIVAFFADEIKSYDASRADDLEDYTDIVAWERTLGFSATTIGCDDFGFADDVYKIFCQTEGGNEISRTLGNPDAITGWGLDIKDGKIIAIYPEWNRIFIDNNLFPLKSYILKKHISDYQKLYKPQDINLVRGEENLELLKTFMAEFLASQQPSTASEQIGFAFFEARNTWNAQAMVDLLADEVESFDVIRADDLEDYTDVFAWDESLNTNWTVKTCDDLDHNDGVSRIKCVVEISNDISRGLGNKVYDMDWRFSIKDDKIILISPSWGSAFAQDNLVPFKYYILETNKEDFDKMYTSQGLNFVRGEENLELLKTYVPEFLAAQE